MAELQRTAVVTGASRGIGLALCRKLLAEGYRVVAIVRTLQTLESRLNDAVYAEIDLSRTTEVRAKAEALSLGPVDVLIHAAADFGGEAFTFANFDVAHWDHVFRTNVIGPAALSRALYDQVAGSAERKVVFLSTGNASISQNTSGEMLAYRTSKTALNQLCRTMAHETITRGVITACVDPGWVRTRMGGPNAPLSPDESAQNVYDFISGLKPEHNGGYFSVTYYRLPY